MKLGIPRCDGTCGPRVAWIKETVKILETLDVQVYRHFKQWCKRHGIPIDPRPYLRYVPKKNVKLRRFVVVSYKKGMSGMQIAKLKKVTAQRVYGILKSEGCARRPAGRHKKKIVK